MFIEQPPWLYRIIFGGAIWRKSENKKYIYLTFDDGPIPEVTPWVLDILDTYKIRATFFCVGDNVRKYPEIYQQLLEKGHRVGNHTFNHIQGICTNSIKYVKNVIKAEQWIQSDLFRPPHGHMRQAQLRALKKKYKIIMWDVVTRDYSPHMTSEGVVKVVKKYTRNGSIIVFHDSLKSIERLKQALPESIEWLIHEGYQFKTL